jgi:hypothetical protein
MGWHRIPSTSTVHQRYRCDEHGCEWDTNEEFQISPWCVAHGVCPDCTRPPKRPADIEVPSYWRRTTIGTPPIETLRCDYHHEQFGLEEACRQCLVEDETSPEVTMI